MRLMEEVRKLRVTISETSLVAAELVANTAINILQANIYRYLPIFTYGRGPRRRRMKSILISDSMLHYVRKHEGTASPRLAEKYLDYNRLSIKTL